MDEENPELSRDELLQRYGRQAPRAPGSERRSPFKFLDSYDLADADIFFGRDTEIEELLGHFRSYGHVLIYGESGSGKSSLVHCGLRSQIPEADALFIPLRVHTAGLPAVCHQICESASQQLGEAVEFSPEAGLVETLRTAHEAASRPIVLFFDQFEELFIFHDSEIRREFAEELASVRTARLNVKVLIGVRQDFLGHLSELEDTVEGLFDNRFWLRRMSRENAAQAVVMACATCEVKIDGELAQAILHRLDPGGQGVELPYLQVVMDRLYRQAVEANPTGPVITAGDVEKLGDITDILGTFLVEEVGKLPSPDIGRQILKAFVTREGTRRTLDRAAVAQQAAGFGEAIPGDALEAHLNQLAGVRILREIADTESFELRHDALAATVAGWISEVEKELIEVRDNLANRHKEYEARGRDKSALLDQAFLGYLAVYRERLKPLLSESLQQYVKDSERHVGQAARLRRRIRQLVTGAVGSVILGCLVVALWQWNAATQREEEAKLATATAERQLYLNHIQQGLAWLERADGRLAQDPKPPDRFAAALMAARAIGFSGSGRESANQDFHDENIDFLTGGTAAANRSRARAILRQPVILPIWQSPLFRHHDGPIDAVTFKADTLISGSSRDGVFKLWNSKPETGNQIRAIGDPSSKKAISVAISPDGKTLASGWDDGVVRVWNAETGEQISPIRAFSRDKGVSSLAFSPNGETLASGSSNGNIKIWEVSTGSEIGFLPGITDNKDDPIESLAFSPDGKRLAAGSCEGALTLWNVEERESIVLVPAAQEDPVYSLAFDPSGQILASGGEDGALRLWDGKTGAALPTLVGHTSEVWCVSFAPGGKVGASGSSDGIIKLWNAVTGEETASLRGRQAGVRSLSFSPDGEMLASGGETGLLQLWNVVTGEEIDPCLDAQGSVTSVSFSPDRQHFASGAKNGTLKLWDATSGKALPIGGHQNAISAVAFSSPNGKTLASRGVDGTIKLWQVPGGQEIPSPAADGWPAADGSDFASIATGGDEKVDPAISKAIAADDVASLTYSPDGKLLAIGSNDGTIRIWDTIKGRLLEDNAANSIGFLAGHRDSVQSLAFSSDSQTLISGSEDGTVKFWRVHTGLEKRVFAGGQSAMRAAYAHGTIASGAFDGSIKLWNAKSGTEIGSWKDQEKNYVNSVAFDPTRKRLALASDEAIRLWNWGEDAGGERIKLFPASPAALCVAFSADGAILASGQLGDGMIRLWDVESAAEIGSIQGHDGSVKAVAFQPASAKPILATGGNDKLIKLWELQTAEDGSMGLHLLHVLDDHAARVWTVAFSPDGQMLASGSKDRSIVLWNVKDGTKIRPMYGHEAPVGRLAFSPDGVLLASGSDDGNLRIWDVRDVKDGEKDLHLHSHYGHGNPIFGCGFSSDSKTLATAGTDLIKLWDVEYLVQSQLPDLAAYLAGDWLELDEAHVRWKTTTENLYDPSPAFDFLNVSPFSQLGKLQNSSAVLPDRAGSE